MERFVMDGYTVTLQPGAAGTGLVVLPGRELPEAAGCSLLGIDGLDWQRDLAPWDAPAAFARGEAFSGGADAFLQCLTERILPEAERYLPAPPAWKGIAGYSLAGLFAVYCLYRTDVFSRAASVSGSLWFPDFLTFAEQNAPKRLPERLYFSLGVRESRTKNPYLSQVAACTERLSAHFAALGVQTRYEQNPGGHFQDPAGRVAAALRWLEA